MLIFKYILIILYLSTLTLYGMDLSKKDFQQPLLLDSTLYIDHTKEITIDTIKQKKFNLVEKKEIGFGYAPDFNIWIKVKLTNPYNEEMKRIIEYTNPLTTAIEVYDGGKNTLLYSGGTSVSSVLKSINPAFPIVLLPHEHKIYYFKVSSSVTTLIVGLTLWEINTFYQHESKHQFILALFFGAMSIIILYNLFIYFFVREKIYLYYILAFSGIVFHHLLYKGLGGLYFFTPEVTMSIVSYASFIVAIPAFFLALFTKNILKLEQYPKLTKFLYTYLILFVGMTLFSYIMDLNNLRNLFSVLLLIILFSITLYTLIQNNRQAKFIMLGWVALMSSGLLMYLSSIGYYDIFDTFPYYVETSLLLENVLFSLILADRLKQLRLDKIRSQEELISYRIKEEAKLAILVEEKTSQLHIALKEKDLLLQELNHRVKNSIQTIVSFLRLQVDAINDAKMQKILIDIENRIMSISHLYNLLYTKDNISYINAYEYFSLLIENIENTLQIEEVNTKIETNVVLHSEVAIYCGFIINEVITNAFQHAFSPDIKGNIFINLVKKNNYYHLSIQDNGKGFDTSNTRNNLGLDIIESLAIYQLQGTLHIEENNGTLINIKWENKHG